MPNVVLSVSDGYKMLQRPQKMTSHSSFNLHFNNKVKYFHFSFIIIIVIAITALNLSGPAHIHSNQSCC